MASAGLRRIELVLYTSPNTMLSGRAFSNLTRLLAEYDAAQVLLTLCDVSKDPHEAEADQITFTPTLVRRYPEPRAWILGDLDDLSTVVRMLSAAGVHRASEQPGPPSFQPKIDKTVASVPGRER